MRFPALILAFWIFEGLAATKLFRATLPFIENRLWLNFMSWNHGRY